MFLERILRPELRVSLHDLFQQWCPTILEAQVICGQQNIGSQPLFACNIPKHSTHTQNACHHQCFCDALFNFEQHLQQCCAILMLLLCYKVSSWDCCCLSCSLLVGLYGLLLCCRLLWVPMKIKGVNIWRDIVRNRKLIILVMLPIAQSAELHWVSVEVIIIISD